MTGTVSIKMHDMQGKMFLSCCDSELIGKSFTEGKTCLRVTESFYRGDEYTAERAGEIIQEHFGKLDSLHLIGKQIIDCVVNLGLISRDGCRRTCGIPHVMFINF
ncbi:MAG: DUF424 family protein [Promethearchaeota archaeon]